ncbi:hypothetical protein [Nonomuraea sediminis]|uniref:hypothetical protein n=1 Tax=Nonomuraea sediminis TaxID=2835864 RepID=UPI001BDC99AA|nr:hypothetical protein [Nonomuraea sediminis]
MKRRMWLAAIPVVIACLVPTAASAQETRTARWGIKGEVISDTGLAPRLVTVWRSDNEGHTAIYTLHEDQKVTPYLQYGETIYVACWIEGPARTGPYGTSTKWDVYGAGGRAVPDAWVYTGKDIADQTGHCA